MTRYLLIATSAFAVAVGLTPLLRSFAYRRGWVAEPAPRKLHLQTIPILGGVAIYTGFVVALLAFGDRFYVNQAIGILLGATLCSFLGLWDDRTSLPAWAKLLGQLLATLPLILTGVQVRLLPHAWANIALTVLWTVGITNAMNLLDNMDGLSGGIGSIAAAFFLLLAAGSGQYLVGALAAALLGACIGFLVYNLNPASIFMGDTGSLFLGYMLAAVGIKLRFPDNVTFVTWMIPIAVLGLPILDTALVTLSRLRRGLNPLTAAGKDHISHRLVKLGYTQREAVLILYLGGGALGVIAVYLTQASVLEGYVVGGIAFLTCCYLIWRLEQVGPLEPTPRAAGSNEPT